MQIASAHGLVGKHTSTWGLRECRPPRRGGNVFAVNGAIYLLVLETGWARHFGRSVFG